MIKFTDVKLNVTNNSFMAEVTPLTSLLIINYLMLITIMVIITLDCI